MSSTARYGFRPSRHLHGLTSFNIDRYPVSANHSKSMFPGDVVELLGDGNIRVVDTSAVSVNERGTLGVVARVHNSNDRPLTHNLPATGNYLPASTAGWAYVYSDPDIVYVADADGTASAGNTGMFVRVTAGAGTTAAGISGMGVKMVDSSASSVGHRFRILGVSPAERLGPSGTEFQGGNDVEVIIADHEFRRMFKRIGAF